MFEVLTSKNVVMYQMKSYMNYSCCTMDEFSDDMKRFEYIKRLFYRYHVRDILKERLILNHLIVLYNILESESCTRLLFFKIDVEYYYILKTFLLFMDRLPNKVYGIGYVDVDTISIDIDRDIFLTFPFFNGIHRFLPAFFKGYDYQTLFVNVDHRARMHGVSKYGTVNRLFRGIIDIIKVKKIIKNHKKLKNVTLPLPGI